MVIDDITEKCTLHRNVKPQLKFRSYNPQSEDFKEKKLPKAKPEDSKDVRMCTSQK